MQVSINQTQSIAHVGVVTNIEKIGDPDSYRDQFGHIGLLQVVKLNC